MDLPGKVCGFYIAHHFLFDAVFGKGCMYKVGHSGSLGDRLFDSAYITCFPEGFKYVATFETSSKEEAHKVETAVLHCCREFRVDGRELVRLSADQILEVARSVVSRLGVNIKERAEPVYPRTITRVAEPAKPAFIAQVEDLTVQQPIDDILSLDWETMAAKESLQQPKQIAMPEYLDEPDEPEIPPDPAFDICLTAEPSPPEFRDYQRDAVKCCLAELCAKGKAILQMACRTGKTPVAFGIMESFLDNNAALFLVPGLSLLRQTAQKLASYGLSIPMLLVGSDVRPVGLPGGRMLTMTTDPAAIRGFLKEKGRKIVISTYQSSPQIPTDAFALTVFDECHRVCGGLTPRPFNYTIKAPRAGARLFMTATPAYDPPSRSPITMKDKDLFGGVAYRYHLRTGINAKYVNDFRLQIVAAPAPAASASEEMAAPGQIVAAMRQVDKLLVFCRDIKHAARLCAETQAAPLGDTAPFECFIAHSRLSGSEVAAALGRFSKAGHRGALFNCRLFQEGVEIPELNAVFFAAPRRSFRDIIQSVCRPLNRREGKPESVVFLPVLHDAQLLPTHIDNLKRFAVIADYVDALLDEDPRLYEHLIDPTTSSYPLGVVGTAEMPQLRAPLRQKALLGALRHAVCYRASVAKNPVNRLLQVKAMPWASVFSELRRVVRECGRYPKTTDGWRVGGEILSLHKFYRWAADQYVEFKAGRPSDLEPWQVQDLETLPYWDLFGVHGPYPWKLCMDFLEQWLREHGGVPPMVEINKGGYVGLEATAMERLSGVLTCINQGDGRARANGAPGSGFTVSAERQADLDRICKKYKLRWRKERDDGNGEIDENGEPTFIQEAYSRFKAYKEQFGVQGEYIQRWFPGYPTKHKFQENLEVRSRPGVLPPKLRSGKQAAAKKA